MLTLGLGLNVLQMSSTGTVDCSGLLRNDRSISGTMLSREGFWEASTLRRIMDTLENGEETYGVASDTHCELAWTEARTLTLPESLKTEKNGHTSPALYQSHTPKKSS